MERARTLLYRHEHYRRLQLSLPWHDKDLTIVRHLLLSADLPSNYPRTSQVIIRGPPKQLSADLPSNYPRTSQAIIRGPPKQLSTDLPSNYPRTSQAIIRGPPKQLSAASTADNIDVIITPENNFLIPLHYHPSTG